MVIYHYPKCTTCKKALQFLKKHNLSFVEKHIVENPPTKEVLGKIIEKSGLPIQRFFNTSGMKYRELGLKEKLKKMSDEEKLELLASDGMLIKRPLVTDEEKSTVGFKEELFQETWV